MDIEFINLDQIKFLDSNPFVDIPTTTTTTTTESVPSAPTTTSTTTTSI